jgi:hypothetical protein
MIGDDPGAELGREAGLGLGERPGRVPGTGRIPGALHRVEHVVLKDEDHQAEPALGEPAVGIFVRAGNAEILGDEREQGGTFLNRLSDRGGGDPDLMNCTAELAVEAVFFVLDPVNAPEPEYASSNKDAST